MANYRKNVTDDMKQVVCDYFKRNGTVCEYKDVERVREVLKLTNADEVTDKLVYDVFCKVTGYHSATYIKGASVSHDPQELTEQVMRLVDNMEDEFESLTDIAVRANLAHKSGHFWQTPTTHREFPRSVAECVQYLAERKFIEGIEIKTCGKVAIRLYRVR